MFTFLFQCSDTLVGFFQTPPVLPYDVDQHIRELFWYFYLVQHISTAINSYSNGITNVDPLTLVNIISLYNNMLDSILKIQELIEFLDNIERQLNNINEFNEGVIREMNNSLDVLRGSRNNLVEAFIHLENRLISENPAFVIQSLF